MFSSSETGKQNLPVFQFILFFDAAGDEKVSVLVQTSAIAGAEPPSGVRATLVSSGGYDSLS